MHVLSSGNVRPIVPISMYNLRHVPHFSANDNLCTLQLIVRADDAYYFLVTGQTFKEQPMAKKDARRLGVM